MNQQNECAQWLNEDERAEWQNENEENINDQE